jgi:cell division septation protein DedD
MLWAGSAGTAAASQAHTAKPTVIGQNDWSGEIMTETNTGAPDGTATGSTGNENTARIGVVPKLEAKREETLRRPGESRRPRKLRVAGVLTVLLGLLGIGWGAGLKTSEFVDLAHVSMSFHDTAGVLISDLGAKGRRVMEIIAALASTSASQAPIRQDRAPAEIDEHPADGLGIKIDLLRASTATVIGELGRGFEHLERSVERGQRELLAKLEQLQQRLEHLETRSSGASSTGQAQPVEKPAATGQPAVSPQAPASGPAPKPTPKPTTAPTANKRSHDWVVIDVLDGTAILEGPTGIIGVSSGDVVPGVGRVESIARRSGKWVVATSKGLITGK